MLPVLHTHLLLPLLLCLPPAAFSPLLNLQAPFLLVLAFLTRGSIPHLAAVLCLLFSACLDSLFSLHLHPPHRLDQRETAQIASFTCRWSPSFCATCQEPPATKTPQTQTLPTSEVDVRSPSVSQFASGPAEPRSSGAVRFSEPES